MKRLLITGANSYIGTSFEKWMMQWSEEYQVHSVGTRNDEWKKLDFSPYDTIFHVAGIVHIKETSKNRNLYYSVNRDLAYEVASKAKIEKVSQFIFLSSMSVYGVENGVIDKNTPLNPNNAYGKSKLEAERLINDLNDENFKVAIVRPPMVYGKGCGGNYYKLSKLALKSPFFPYIDNQRSMIYIDNLSEHIKQLVDKCINGLFLPQNAEYVSTSEMVKMIAEAHDKHIITTKLLNPLIRRHNNSLVNKLFGNLTYKKEISQSLQNYIVCDFKESILKTELRN